MKLRRHRENQSPQVYYCVFCDTEIEEGWTHCQCCGEVLTQATIHVRRPDASPREEEIHPLDGPYLGTGGFQRWPT